MSATSPSWICEGCTLTVRFAPGFPVPDLPAGWQRGEDGLRCLRCSRTMAVDEAIAAARAAGDDRSDDAIRREALVRKELQRDPTRSAGEIGQSIGYGASAVGITIRSLRAAEAAGEAGV